MGEASRRRALGLAPRSEHCPVRACRHRYVIRHSADSVISQTLARAWGGVEPCGHSQCCRCMAIWETRPAGWNTDNVERATGMGLCNNCAFRASSPETRDPETRAWLHGHAIEAAEHGYEISVPTFVCHKGIPLKIIQDPPSVEYDFAAAGIDPRDQTCAGYLRLLWAKNGASKARRERLAGDHENHGDLA